MLYKYRSFNDYKFEQVFEEGLLYFAKPAEFNDPFESKPKITGIETLEQRKVYARDYIARQYPGIGFKKRKELEKQIVISMADERSVRERLHDTFNNYGILCLSKKWDKILMWSHYSMKHSGICIGFDFNCELDDDYGSLHEVRYKSEYPEVHPGIFGSDDEKDLNELFEVTMQRKSNVWSYEEEVRFIKLRYEGGSGTYPFKKEKIKEIILGACISKENEEKILRLKQSYAPNAQIFRATLSQSSYCLERVLVSDG
ncbi:DUF2971 domain-containing protein [Microbulbifer rhizosphaerae]|uniref:DUF2971 domain-containing protein n=1 Tax=Microbulbifer rhizosphaerae TaxID=1562603 RepID=A0A7W4Z7V6_9GAMM|nr:DUF2971 domain-containing protein [Microbulbifer rhizosphaerae]MBB3059922.1 hypothetical protein [Microbulbifer rhizosphaerae]